MKIIKSIKNKYNEDKKYNKLINIVTFLALGDLLTTLMWTIVVSHLISINLNDSFAMIEWNPIFWGSLIFFLIIKILFTAHIHIRLVLDKSWFKETPKWFAISLVCGLYTWIIVNNIYVIFMLFSYNNI